jgi:hypothetical protein
VAVKTSRAVFPLVLLLSALAFAQRVPDASMFFGEASRDCAPWDGAAFSVSIPLVAGLRRMDFPLIHVSVWQAPGLNLKGAEHFEFPDVTGKIGAAFIQPRSGPVTPLHGTISFKRVMPNETTQGQFDFVVPNGRRYSGKFTATWNGKMMMCG